MSITTQSPSTTNRSTHPNIVHYTNNITNIVDNDNKTLIIILAVTLPTLAVIGLLISLILCYRRRRYTKSWLKRFELENSSRLQTIVVNLPPTSIQPQYSEKNLCLSYPQFQQPRTKTIVYNRLSAPSTPVVYSPFKLPIQGETNAAFDEQLFKNEEQSILKSSSSNIDPSTKTTLQKDFPVSLQAPVPTITSELVQAIATHRFTGLADPNNTSLETSASTTTSNSSQNSGTSSSDSNSSQIVLLFSQRTEF